MRPIWFLVCLVFPASPAFAHEQARVVPATGGSLVAVPAETGMEGTARPAAPQRSDIIDRAYPLMAARWPFDNIFVCWESSARGHPDQRRLVQEAIAETWDRESGLAFVGWGECQAGSRGIRIAVEDTGAHVKYIGVYLDGEPDGMVLNFTYANWNQGCQDRPDWCSRVIAVHEFGHAIGFAHEQNRPDTPGECGMAPQGKDGDTVTLTPWDPHSVMNYCNETYSNDGRLSDFDIAALRHIYGNPE